MKKIHFSEISLLIFAILLISCEIPEKKNKNNNPENEEIIATINNKNILVPEFQKKVQNFLERFPNIHQHFGNNNNRIKKLVMDQIVNEELIRQEAKKNNLTITKDELNSQINQFSEQSGKENNIQFGEQELTRSLWEERYKYQLLFKKLIEHEQNTKISVSESEIKNYYRNNRTQFVQPLQYEVLHIQVQDQKTAKSIHKDLKNKKTPFKEMVETHSISPDRATEGNMGLITRKVLPEIFDHSIFSLKKKNQLSEVIQSPFGYHIFKLARKIPRKRLSYDTVKEDIARYLRRRKFEQQHKNWMVSLKSRANISIARSILQSDEGF